MWEELWMKNTKWLKEGTFAHRGLHNSKLPENTIAAFSHAVEHGFDVELDIQLTKDKLLVVCHDHTLTRLCSVKKKIRNLTYSQLQELKIRESEHSIPLLTDVLDTFPKSTKLLLELKKSINNRALVSIFLDTMKGYDFTYAVLSFDPRIVNLFKKKAPHLIRGFIRKDKPTKSWLLNGLFKLIPVIRITKPDYIMHKLSDLPNKKVETLQKNGMIILVYTAKNRQEYHKILQRYDNAVFEGFLPVE